LGTQEKTFENRQNWTAVEKPIAEGKSPRAHLRLVSESLIRILLLAAVLRAAKFELSGWPRPGADLEGRPG